MHALGSLKGRTPLLQDPSWAPKVPSCPTSLGHICPNDSLRSLFHIGPPPESKPYIRPFRWFASVAVFRPSCASWEVFWHCFKMRPESEGGPDVVRLRAKPLLYSAGPVELQRSCRSFQGKKTKTTQGGRQWIDSALDHGLYT